MSKCKYYHNLTGIKGNCKSDPTRFIDGGWQHPVVEKDCHCRFYNDDKTIGVTEDVKLTARQKALAKKKEQQDALKNSQS